ncbi:UNVERIFIED_ORG: hypothetical protein GGE64_003943 [Rhizobium etli]
MTAQLMVSSDNAGFRKLEKRGSTAKSGDSRMIYALRRRAGSDRQTLVEFAGKRALQAAIASGENSFSIIRAGVAHNWVLRGAEHETGLYMDGTRVRYAQRLADIGSSAVVTKMPPDCV